MRLIKKLFCINYPDKGRIEQFDFYRGGAVLLVLFQHTAAPLNEYILAFHMPFFFNVRSFTI